MRMLRPLGFLGCLLASTSADAPTCCACSPPASSPPPAEVQCAGDYGSTVGGKPCCAQAGRIASALHICPRHLPACSGYKHSLSFGSCLSREEAAQRAKDEAAEEGGDDPPDGGDGSATVGREDVGEDDGDGDDYAANYSTRASRGNWSGVYNASAGMRSSTHLDKEIEKIVRLLALRPGMTYCELGCGSGEWVAGVGRAVMPGGKVIVTAPHASELQDCKAATKHQGFAAEGATPTPNPNPYPNPNQASGLRGRRR